MPSKTLISLLVGSHFNPPAKTLLQFLPGDAPVHLVPDPDNPYDSNAIKVMLPTTSIPENQFAALEEALPAQGATLEQVMSGEECQLGHVAASSGKPLLTAKSKFPDLARDLVGNIEFLDWVKDPKHEAVLGWAADGSPLVMLRTSEEEPEA